MTVKFFRDNHNARFVWSWHDGSYTTSDSAEIEHLVGLGLRYEVCDSVADKTNEETEDQPKRRGRKPK